MTQHAGLLSSLVSRLSSLCSWLSSLIALSLPLPVVIVSLESSSFSPPIILAWRCTRIQEISFTNSAGAVILTTRLSQVVVVFGTWQYLQTGNPA